MPGDVGYIAKLLSEVFGYFVDPTGFEQLTREKKLAYLMRGIDEAIDKKDARRADELFDAYRKLRQQTGP